MSAKIGMAEAEDQEILAYASQNGWVIVTLDADFHALLEEPLRRNLR